MKNGRPEGTGPAVWLGFAKGQGADPATKDTATDFGNEGGTDALTN